MLDVQKRGVLPFNTDGYVLGEYARRQANSYLSMYVGLQAIATTSVFVPLECPIWQFLIEIRLPQRSTIGVFGMLDVDARSGVEIQPAGEGYPIYQRRPVLTQAPLIETALPWEQAPGPTSPCLW